PLSKLSGGEKRRLHLLSVLFLNPNFLILDEPTNDLDLQTLRTLEEFLLDFPGCILIVSHDRYFMDRLVDHLFAFEGDGIIRDFPGNYSQYREQQELNNKEQKKVTDVVVPKIDQKPAIRNQLSFKEKREFELIEKELPDLQKEKALLENKMNSGNMAFDELQKAAQRIGDITQLIDEKEMRWLELSERV
ncbi:MAG TPA: ATP-binding cassette domain-containing protein, partial [Ferruginibacter sp.]|nr:ATP-binding cassette domain-containing protein [Ferruginibacter sp.]